MSTGAAPARLHHEVLEWYAVSARDLPWRRPDATPWGIFVSEVMLQQTPVARVEPVWHAWLSRWPTPGDLAAEAPGEAVRAWGRLGYPRRALRLHAAAVAITEHHGGAVPASEAELLTLPGVGTYTAAAVATFAFGERTTVVDTNVRRVLARVVGGAGVCRAVADAGRAHRGRRRWCRPRRVRPGRGAWRSMELGAIVCTARAPRCSDCPVADLCAWQLAGRPAYQGPARKGQAWEGTDRQLRGALLAVLRESTDPVPRSALEALSDNEIQRERCLDSLVADGLVEPLAHDLFRLPAVP